MNKAGIKMCSNLKKINHLLFLTTKIMLSDAEFKKKLYTNILSFRQLSDDQAIDYLTKKNNNGNFPHATGKPNKQSQIKAYNWRKSKAQIFLMLSHCSCNFPNRLSVKFSPSDPNNSHKRIPKIKSRQKSSRLKHPRHTFPIFSMANSW